MYCIVLYCVVVFHVEFDIYIYGIWDMGYGYDLLIVTEQRRWRISISAIVAYVAN